MSDIVALNETGVCDSCDKTAVLFAVPHQQENNDHVWHYCDLCAFAHKVEAKVQEELVKLMAVNAQAANDPATVAEIRTGVAKNLINTDSQV